MRDIQKLVVYVWCVLLEAFHLCQLEEKDFVPGVVTSVCS